MDAMTNAEADSAALGFVNPDVVTRQSELRDAYQNAKPFRHVVIDNFFDLSALQGLLSEFPSVAKPGVGDYGGAGKKQGTTSVREFGPNFSAWDSYVSGQDFKELMETITGIDDLLYDPDYIGAGVHENFEGYRSQIHIDYNFHPKTNHHRRFNLIVYVTEDWVPEHGGGLVLCEDGYFPDDGHVERVPCVFNRAIIFETTEHSWHGVEAIAFPHGIPPRTRKSITVYMYTKDRPAEETADFHETIYLPGPMPQQVKPGVQIDDTVMEDIQLFVDDARGLIKGLYAHHQVLLQRLRNQMSVASSYERNYHLPLLGVLDVRFDRAAADPAGWIGQTFQATLRPFESAQKLTVELVRHEGFTDSFDLDVSFGGRHAKIERDGNAVTATLDLKTADEAELKIDVTSSADLSQRPRLFRLSYIRFG